MGKVSGIIEDDAIRLITQCPTVGDLTLAHHVETNV